MRRRGLFQPGLSQVARWPGGACWTAVYSSLTYANVSAILSPWIEPCGGIPDWRLKLVRGECKVGRINSTPVMGGPLAARDVRLKRVAEEHRGTGLLSIAEDKKEPNRTAVRSVSTIMSAFVALLPTACLLCDSHPMCRPLLQFG